MNSVLLNIEDDNWKQTQGFTDWENNLNLIFTKTIDKIYFGKKEFEANLLLSGDETIRDLNKRFRNKDAVTNVLSFPQLNPEEVCKIDTLFYENKLLIGDIIMSHNEIMRESKQFSLSFFDRATHLLVHSVLHLFGFDHIKSAEREKMEGLEIEILQSLGLNNPYVIEE